MTLKRHIVGFGAALVASLALFIDARMSHSWVRGAIAVCWLGIAGFYFSAMMRSPKQKSVAEKNSGR